MKIVMAGKGGYRLSSIMFSIFLMGFFPTGAGASGSSGDVTNFTQLRKALEKGESQINIAEDAIKFRREIPIRHSNITICAPEDEVSKLDGEKASRFFVIDSGLKRIVLKDLEFSSGKFDGSSSKVKINDKTEIDDEDDCGEGESCYGEGESCCEEGEAENDDECESDSDEVEIKTKVKDKVKDKDNDNDNDKAKARAKVDEIANDDSVEVKDGGGAILVAAGAAVTFENDSFNDNFAVSQGGAIFSVGDVASRNILNFKESVVFKGNRSNNGGAISTDFSYLDFSGKATFKDNLSSSRGGALYISRSDLAFDGKTIFRKNISEKSGGAIYSEGDVDRRNVLTFKKAIVFRDNESNTKDNESSHEETRISHATNHGGAVYAHCSKFIFEKETIFKNNSSLDFGGAIYSKGDADSRNIMIFKGKSTFEENKSSYGAGGAIFAALSKLIFEKEVVFRNNNSEGCREVEDEEVEREDLEGCGAAIYSSGSEDSKNIITFLDKSSFDGNGSNGCYGGSAIYSMHSNLTFEGETIFRNNNSSIAGGAIYSRESSVVFEKAAVFENNKSSGVGGALWVMDSELTFLGEAVFENNKSSGKEGGGGALWVIDSELTFFEEAVFKNNSINNVYGQGGAIHCCAGASIKFESGLVLANNTTVSEEKPSGAIHMEGENNSRRTEVTITQKSLKNPTVFEGNKISGKKDVAENIAVYMEEYSALNFILKEGDINLYGNIEGHKFFSGGTVNIGGRGGQFNLREKASINNVDLENEGNLNLADSDATSNLLNFKNSGKITFRIFPEDNHCSGIQARNIILEKNSELEIVALEEDYEAGNSYDILVSEKTIDRSENIDIKLPQNLKARGEFQDNLYRIFIGEENPIEETDLEADAEAVSEADPK
jgi:predicted outer membrane repeat protein